MPAGRRRRRTGLGRRFRALEQDREHVRPADAGAAQPGHGHVAASADRTPRSSPGASVGSASIRGLSAGARPQPRRAAAPTPRAVARRPRASSSASSRSVPKARCGRQAGRAARGATRPPPDLPVGAGEARVRQVDPPGPRRSRHAGASRRRARSRAAARPKGRPLDPFHQSRCILACSPRRRYWPARPRRASTGIRQQQKG